MQTSSPADQASSLLLLKTSLESMTTHRLCVVPGLFWNPGTKKKNCGSWCVTYYHSCDMVGMVWFVDQENRVNYLRSYLGVKLCRSLMGFCVLVLVQLMSCGTALGKAPKISWDSLLWGPRIMLWGIQKPRLDSLAAPKQLEGHAMASILKILKAFGPSTSEPSTAVDSPVANLFFVLRLRIMSWLTRFFADGARGNGHIVTWGHGKTPLLLSLSKHKTESWYEKTLQNVQVLTPQVFCMPRCSHCRHANCPFFRSPPFQSLVSKKIHQHL